MLICLHFVPDYYYRMLNPTSKSVLVLFWFAGDFFIKAFYATLLLAFLLSTKYEKPVDTLADVYYTVSEKERLDYMLLDKVADAK